MTMRCAAHSLRILSGNFRKCFVCVCLSARDSRRYVRVYFVLGAKCTHASLPLFRSAKTRVITASTVYDSRCGAARRPTAFVCAPGYHHVYARLRRLRRRANCFSGSGTKANAHRHTQRETHTRHITRCVRCADALLGSDYGSTHTHTHTSCDNYFEFSCEPICCGAIDKSTANHVVPPQPQRIAIKVVDRRRRHRVSPAMLAITSNQPTIVLAQRVRIAVKRAGPRVECFIAHA